MALYPNGRAPDSALVVYRGCKASPDMARRVAWVEREYMRRNPGGYITPNEIYRDYDAQVYWKQYWTDRGYPGNAAAPGYSNHGDWDVGAVDWDADDIGLRTELAAMVGLIRTMLPQESWHYAVRGDPQVDLSGFSADTITPIEEDDMYTDADRSFAAATNAGVVDTVVRLYRIEQKLDELRGWVGVNKWALTGNENPSAGLRSMVTAGFAKLGAVLDDVSDDVEDIKSSLPAAVAPDLAKIKADIQPKD